MVHHRADPSDPEAARRGWLEGRRCDLFEINEAFAVVAMAAQRDSIPRDRLNINGGALRARSPCWSNGRTTDRDLAACAARAKRGIAALCIGGGEATAIAAERMCIDFRVSSFPWRRQAARRSNLAGWQFKR